jgi:hypothetical protein
MAFQHSPKIPTNNLQIYMDFGNPKCYLGSGTSLKNLARPGVNNGYIKNSDLLNSKVNCYYHVFATRKDVEPLQTIR